jgi:O-antigen/teichoic acid export membrane protein
MAATRLVYAVAAIGLAFLWRDFWAVAVAVLLSYILRSAMTFALAPGRVRPRLTAWRDCASFGGWAMVVEVVQYLINSMPQLMIGGALSLAQVGHYRAGNRISVLLTKQLARPLMQVAYPGLAKISRRGGATQEAHALLNASVLAVMLPLGFGLALVSQDLVQLALGPQWEAAGLVIAVMAPLRALESMQAGVRAISLVEGDVRFLALRNAVVLALSVLLVWGGCQFGFIGALVGAAAASGVNIFATLWMSRRYGSEGGVFSLLIAARRSFAATAAMTGAVALLGLALPEANSEQSAIAPLAAKTVAGGVVYCAVHLGLWRLAGRPAGVESALISTIRRRRRA